MLHTGVHLIISKQHARLDALFVPDAHVQIDASWRVYQQLIVAYRQPDRRKGS